MFKEIPDLLTSAQIQELRKIASEAQFADGRVTNKHTKVKNNLQINDAAAYQRSAQIMLQALSQHEDFQNFALPVHIGPPFMTRYTKGMHYGAHPDAAFMQAGAGPLRADISCTIFLSNPGSYLGGALRIHLGTRDLRFRGEAGSAIVYPSNLLHEVEEVTEGERLVGVTFVQSRIADVQRRGLFYEISEVTALEGLKMSFENLTRLQLVQENLLRLWADKP